MLARKATQSPAPIWNAEAAASRPGRQRPPHLREQIALAAEIEALKERIPAQIRVEKGGGVGHSKLAI